jgi:hypothetical protein
MTPAPAWINPESWEAFRAMRKSIKAPLTPYAEKLVIRELVKLKSGGHDPQACLDQSIMNSWRDVFPPRDKGVTATGLATADAELKRMDEQAAKAVPPPASVLELARKLRRAA